MNIRIATLALCSSLLLTACGGDDDMATFELTVTNITSAQPFSPLTAIAAADDFQIFRLAEPASEALEQIAEGGDNSFLLASTEGDERGFATASGMGALMPGMSETLTLSLPVEDLDNAYLSAVTMLVNTNDAITAVHDISLSSLAMGESHRVMARAYDAGTEANSEAQGSIPGPADGGEGFNAERDDTGSVRVHPGVISMAGGKADSVLSEVHRFDNPVAVFSLTRIE